MCSWSHTGECVGLCAEGVSERSHMQVTMQSPNRLKQSPPFPIGLAPAIRLHLPPPAALARPIGRRPALAHHPFEAVLLGHAQQRHAVIEGFGVQQDWAVEAGIVFRIYPSKKANSHRRYGVLICDLVRHAAKAFNVKRTCGIG
jgi:hypothetical protein